MHRLFPIVLSIFLACAFSLSGAVLGSADAFADETLPKMSVVLERMSQALGGPRGGLRILEKADEVDFVFHRVVRDAQSRHDIEAEHRLVRTGGKERLRLDVRVSGDEGIDSASLIDGASAWVIAEGERHEANVGALRSRLSEFAPHRLFSAPLTLATDGKGFLGDAALRLSREETEGGARLILSGGGENSTVRIVLSATTYRPLEVAFRSLSGDVAYHYEDYREVAPGLILPFVREFHRKGLRVSRTTVRRLILHVRSNGGLFSPETTKLPALPKGP